MSMDFRDLLDEIVVNAWAYGISVLICLGTIGNCLCVLVPFEMKNMVSLYYFVALAISNEAFIIFLLAERIFHFLGYDLFQTGICQIFIYIPTILQFLSVYIIVAFIVERFEAVSFPQRRQAMHTCTLANAKMVIIGLTFLGFVLPSSLFRIHDSNCYMDETWRNWKLGFSLANAIFIDVVPYVVITALGIRIGMSIRGPTARGRILPHSTTSGTDYVFAGQQSSSVLRAKQTKITRIFLIVAVVYIYLNLSTNLTLYFIAIESDWTFTVMPVYSILSIFSSTSLGINFFLCCAIDQDFRQAALAIRLCRSQIRSTVPQTIQYTRGNSFRSAPTLTTSSGNCMTSQDTTVLEMSPDANAERVLHSYNENTQNSKYLNT